jgi:hypothetical protein
MGSLIPLTGKIIVNNNLKTRKEYKEVVMASFKLLLQHCMKRLRNIMRIQDSWSLG